MKLKIDTHIHTISSGHAYSTVKEIIDTAIEKKLECIAITDHSPGMPGSCGEFHFWNLSALPREVITKGSTLRILTGAELNIMSYDGDVDLSENLCKSLDIVIASLHPPCIPFGSVEQNTNAIINTMKKKYVNIIGHPCDPRYPFDIEKVVKAAKETKTLLELNNSSFESGSMRAGGEAQILEMLRLCKEINHPIVVGSDSHICYSIGEFGRALDLLEQSEMPENLVVNTDFNILSKYII